MRHKDESLFVDCPENLTMFPKGQPVPGRGPAYRGAPLPLGCGAIITKAGGRDGGAEHEGREMDRLVQSTRTARRLGALDELRVSRSSAVWVLAQLCDRREMGWSGC